MSTHQDNVLMNHDAIALMCYWRGMSDGLGGWKGEYQQACRMPPPMNKPCMYSPDERRG
ncbi:hypothetical protein [Vibrio cortegadensis]|uniref:hypothetical protein n=1 Tax=Vibrio cortegadensis TaxID=1328770 RepID=UPI0021C46A39|nr:hypothetical protein [Vibrio cortegadensis]